MHAHGRDKGATLPAGTTTVLQQRNEVELPRGTVVVVASGASKAAVPLPRRAKRKG
jgi:hypothetical protein